jgi:hypothetical protein
LLIALLLWCIVMHAAHSPASLAQSITEPEISLRLRATPRRVKVAEPIRLQLEVVAPHGARVNFPLTANTLGPFQIVDQSSVNDIPMDGNSDRRTWIQNLTLESLVAGTLTIEPLEVAIELPNHLSPAAPSRTLRTDPLEIEVRSLLTDDDNPEDFRDIKGTIPRDNSQASGSLTKWLAFGSIPMVTIGLLLLRKCRRGSKWSAAEWMQREIDQLEALTGSNQLSPTDSYTQLAAALRRFLERETGIPAITLSTPEIREALEQHKVPTATIAAIFQFLTTADEVRFSGVVDPDGRVNERVWSELREIVRQVHQPSFGIDRGE